MEAVAPAPAAADQATDFLQKLSLEGKKEDAVGDAAKKPSGMPYGSANAGDAQSQVDRSITPLLQEAMDPNFYYQSNGYASPAYYYPTGYDGSANEWDSRYAGHEGMEMPPNVYGDMYHGYGYAPYGPYPSGSPVPTVGHDAQIQSYGTQHYQYPTQYYQRPVQTNVTHGVNGASSQSELPSVAAHQTHVPVDSAKTGANGTANGFANTNNSSLPRKQAHRNLPLANNGSYGGGPLQGGPSANNYGHSGLHSPVQWYDGPVYSNGHQRSTASSTSHGLNLSSAKNQSQRPTTNLMGMHAQIPSSGMGLTSPSYPTRMYPDSRLYGQYGQYGNTMRSGLGYGSNVYNSRNNGSNVYNSRNNGRWGVVDPSYKPRGRAPFGFGSENQDGFTELNRGPRSGGFKHQQPYGPTVTIAVKGQALPSIGKQENSVLPDIQFNQEAFPVTYKDAKFFVIKSYSEDDVHKSIKYNVWASTPNGNKKLDAGYREAQEKSSECPVFLFFSVNTSGQFVGVAEMVGPVDFDKTVDYWQQDKWNGCFPVKWHIVKDVPNNILKHITLDNNDNYHCSWWKRQVAQSSHAAYNFAPLLTEWITTSGAVSPETALTASEEGDKMLRMGYRPGRPGFDRKKLLLYAIICGCRWQIDRLLKDLPTLFNTIEDFLWFKLSALREYTSTSSSDVLNEGLLPYTLEDLQNYLNQFEPSYYTKSGKDPLIYPYVFFLSIQLLPIILYLSKEVGEEGYHVDAVHISIALADHGVLPNGVGSGQKMGVMDACAEAANIIRQYGSIHLCNGNLDLALEYYAQAAAALGGREVSWIGQGNADFIKGIFPGFYSQTIKSWFPEEHT